MNPCIPNTPAPSHLARHCLLALLLVTLSAGAGEVPAIDPLVWKFPHELVWELADGPVWFSVGHTATILTIVPETGRVTVSAAAVTAFDGSGTPAAFDPLASTVIATADPAGPAPKAGLHRKRNGIWDFHFGTVPPAPYTLLPRLFFQRSPRFRYCLTIHAVGEAATDGTWKALRINVLIAELLDDPDLPPTLSWPAGAPMPRDAVPTADWYARESPPAPWAADFPVRGDFGGGRALAAAAIPRFIKEGPGYEVPALPDRLDTRADNDRDENPLPIDNNP